MFTCKSCVTSHPLQFLAQAFYSRPRLCVSLPPLCLFFLPGTRQRPAAECTNTQADLSLVTYWHTQVEQEDVPREPQWQFHNVRMATDLIIWCTRFSMPILGTNTLRTPHQCDITAETQVTAVHMQATSSASHLHTCISAARDDGCLLWPPPPLWTPPAAPPTSDGPFAGNVPAAALAVAAAAAASAAEG